MNNQDLTNHFTNKDFPKIILIQGTAVRFLAKCIPYFELVIPPLFLLLPTGQNKRWPKDTKRSTYTGNKQEDLWIKLQLQAMVGVKVFQCQHSLGTLNFCLNISDLVLKKEKDLPLSLLSIIKSMWSQSF